MATSQLVRQLASLAYAYWPVILTTLLVGRAVYRRYLHPLHNVPGPFWASITSLWLVAVQFDHAQHHRYLKLHHRYGPVVRVSPNRVLFNSPDRIKEYWNWDKAKFWTAFSGHPTVIPHGQVIEASKHSAAKAKIMGGYSLSNIIKSEDKVDEHIGKLMSELKKRVGLIFDISTWTQYYAFDVVMDIVFSRPVGFLVQGVDVNGLIASIHDVLVIGSVAGLFVRVFNFLNHPLWWPAFSPKPTDAKGPGAVYGFAYEAVNARLRENREKADLHGDILQWMINRRDHDGKQMSETLLQQEAIAPVLAGSDTTSSSIRSMILYLATTKFAYDKLMAQIDAADAQGLLDTPVRLEQVQRHIPYLEYVRKESIRLSPVGGTAFWREVPPGGTTISGHFIPGGFDAAITHFAVGHGVDFFGDDAHLFRPERWMEEPDPERRRRRDLGDVSFGGGPFSCTGKNIAVMEISKVVVELFRRFDVQIVNPQRPWREIATMAVVHRDFWVRLTERHQPEGIPA